MCVCVSVCAHTCNRPTFFHIFVLKDNSEVVCFSLSLTHTHTHTYIFMSTLFVTIEPCTLDCTSDVSQILAVSVFKSDYQLAPAGTYHDAPMVSSHFQPAVVGGRLQQNSDLNSGCCHFSHTEIQT